MLDRNDLKLLREAKEDWNSLDEIIKISEMIVADSELKSKLFQARNELSYKADEIINNMFDEIKVLWNEEEMLSFIVSESLKKIKEDEKAIKLQME